MMNMKKFYILVAFIIAALSFHGCNFYQVQIDELYAELDSLKQSDRAMRLQLDQLNSSLSDLQRLVSAMQSGLYIKSAVPLMEDGAQTGYLITLSNGETFTIKDGRNGRDGITPSFGVKRGSDGVYYWTVDGEFLSGPSGEPVRADGVTPLFDIRDGRWYISLDGGESWQDIGQATGADGLPGAPGDQIFKSVEYTPGENVVTFVLSDGTSVTLPCYQPISISFTIPGNNTSIAPGETVKVDYTLSYGDSNTVVTASSDGNYIVSISKTSDISGSILINCPGLYMDGHVNVMAFDGVGYAAVAVITFYEKQISFHNGLYYNAPTEGCDMEIPLSFNFDYTLEVEKDSESWIEVITTKADMQEGVINLKVSKNEGDPRTGRVLLHSTNSVNGPFCVINISQDGAYFQTGRSSFVFGSAGGDARVEIWTSKSITVDVPSQASSWISAGLSEVDYNYYSVSISVAENNTDYKRSASVPILDASGNTLASIEIMQLHGNGNNEMDMIFEVRPNESNNFTVYLPVTGMNGCDFTVDWGDGQYGVVNGSSPNADKAIYHHYQSVDGSGETFFVTLSGIITELNSDCIDQGMRSGIVSVVQWGHTQLNNMYHAFYGNTSLSSIPADETLAFGEVISFSGAFANCPRLDSISPHVFDYASKAQDFGNVFYNCSSLLSIPESLFSKCTSAQSFAAAFAHCTHLLSVPDLLFTNCRNAWDFGSVFSDCFSLIDVSTTAFKDCSGAKTFNWLFYNCRSLETVPEGLFADCINVTDFSWTFCSCSEFKSIPVGLFRYNTKVEVFTRCFENCNSLTSIPSHLFDNCTYATNLEGVFGWCHNLKTVPVSLFDVLRKVTVFSYCFCDCNQLEGESPYTTTNGRKVHIYERADYPDYFVTPTRWENCFTNCFNIADWEMIPDEWIY